MTLDQPRRRSDRWLTPAVVIVGIIAGALVVVIVAVLVAYMVARGIDPGPVVQLAGTAGTGLAALAGVVLQLVSRRSQTNTERAAGVLAAELSRANNAGDAGAPRAGADPVPTEQQPLYVDDRGLPPVPPPTRRRGVHRWPDDWPVNGSGPDAAAGEARNRAR